MPIGGGTYGGVVTSGSYGGAVVSSGNYGGGLLRSPSYEGGLVSAGPVGGFIGQSASYGAPAMVQGGIIGQSVSVPQYGGGIVNAGYTPGIVNAGYTPGIVNAGYTPGIVNTGYTPGIINTGYTPGIVNTGYTPDIINVGYTPDIVVDAGCNGGVVIAGNYNGSQRLVRLEEYDLDQFDALQQIGLLSIFKDKVLQTMRASPMAANEVQVTLAQGSLIFVTDVHYPSGNEVWPTKEDARDAVRAVLGQRNNAKPQEPQTPQTNADFNNVVAALALEQLLSPNNVAGSSLSALINGAGKKSGTGNVAKAKSRFPRGSRGARRIAAPMPSLEDIWAKADSSQFDYHYMPCKTKKPSWTRGTPEPKKWSGPMLDSKTVSAEKWLKHHNPAEHQAVLFDTRTMSDSTNELIVFKRTDTAVPVEPKKSTSSGTKCTTTSQQTEDYKLCYAVYFALHKSTQIVDHEKNKPGLHTFNKNPLQTLSPGRGKGIADVPCLSLMNHVRPSDVNKGALSDCWLLSGIAALAEFSGAIERLFDPTTDGDKKPFHCQNGYSIKLYDLENLNFSNVSFNEGLSQNPDGSGGLLGARPSDDGQLWVCYLEKAVAAHCGGWDSIDGGDAQQTCTHAWRLLTGCQDQYEITWGDKDDKFHCNKSASKMKNDPSYANPKSLPNQEWPEGLGSKANVTDPLDAEDLFIRMTEWEDQNYLMMGRTQDGVAYTILECQALGTDSAPIDLIKVRNPLGTADIQSDTWNDGGDGWQQHPGIKKACQPVSHPDDGQFWLSKEDFFEKFSAIYLCVKDMKDFAAGN